MANLKSIKKGDKVMLRMFTGLFVETKTVEMADAKKLGFTSKSGVKTVFDKATGKQIEPKPKAEKYANFIEPYDAEVEKEELAKKNKKKEAAPKKKVAVVKKKAKAVEPEDDFEEPEDDDDMEELD